MTTPMQRLKQNFINLENNLKNKGFKIRKINLNKAKARSDYFGYGYNKKEIENDFVSFYNFIDKEESNIPRIRNMIHYKDFSIGFIFDYINKTEEDFTVSVSLKPEQNKLDKSISDPEEFTKNQERLNGQIITSRPYNLEEFKLLIKEFNKELKEKEKVSELDLIDMVLTKLIKLPEIDNKQFLKQSKKEISQFLKNKEKGIETIQKDIEYKNEELKKETKKMQSSFNRSKEKKEYERLKEEFQIAEKNYRNKQNELMNKYNINSIKNEIKELQEKETNEKNTLKKDKRITTSKYVKKILKR